ncbi:hypothetical protein [Xanthomonas massiliensis]|uniref:hypothetical protein n=1 Tax=Xanthomonas massiliensis TaxID=1720302 RepID=UPI0008271612|nr:hypothetical protein [Xanthomonas massiliensis]
MAACGCSEKHCATRPSSLGHSPARSAACGELLQQALLAAPSDDLQRRIAAALQALPPPHAPAPAA